MLRIILGLCLATATQFDGLRLPESGYDAMRLPESAAVRVSSPGTFDGLRIPDAAPSKPRLKLVVNVRHGCSGCVAMERDAAAGKLGEYDLEFVDDICTEFRQYPHIAFTSPVTGRPVFLDHYEGPNWLRASIYTPPLASVAPPVAVAAPTKPAVPYYAPNQRWTWNGFDNVSREYMIHHLLTGHHAGQFQRSYLESLTTDELDNLHTHHHKKLGY